MKTFSNESTQYHYKLKQSEKIKNIDFLFDNTMCNPANFPDNPFDYYGALNGSLPLPDAGERAGAEVAVIGAGCAGMAASYMLMQLGFKPVVYEQSSRRGGRTYTKPLMVAGKTVAYAEMGAMRIPLSQKLIFDLCHQWGIKYCPFPNPLTIDTAVNIYGEQLVYNAQNDIWTGNAKLIDSIKLANQKYLELTSPLLEQWRAAKGYPEEQSRMWKQFVKDYDNKSFYQVLLEHNWSAELIQLFGYIGIGSGGFNSFYESSFLEIVRIVIQDLEVEQQSIQGGTEQFAENFWTKKVQTPFWGKTSVKDLNECKTLPGVSCLEISDETDKRVTIASADGKIKRYAAAILTASPPAICMTINISQNAFSPDVWSALRSINLTSSTKVFVLTKTVFWQNDASLFMTLTDRSPRQIYLFSAKDDFGMPDSPYGVICLCYAWSASSINFNALSETQRVETCLDALEKIYGAEIRQKVAEEMVTDQSTTICWEDEYGYNGGWRMANPGQQRYIQLMHEQNLGLDPQWNNGLYLAGEAMSWYGLSGWIDGAIKTGIQAAISAVRKITH